MGEWNNRKVPRKPKKPKVVKEDTEAHPAKAPDPKSGEQASDELVASKLSARVGLEELTIGPVKETLDHEGGHAPRGRSRRPEGNVDHNEKVLDHMVPSGSPNHQRKHKQSIARKSEVSGRMTE